MLCPYGLCQLQLTSHTSCFQGSSFFYASTNHPCRCFGPSILLDMKVFHSCLLFLLLSAGLHDAKAGKSSGSKRKHSSDEESEDWWQWSLKLGAENKIPASVAKTNIEKAEKSGADGFKFKGKGKKCFDLRGFERFNEFGLSK